VSSMSRLRRGLHTYVHNTKGGERRKKELRREELIRTRERLAQDAQREEARRVGRVDSMGSPYNRLPGDLDRKI
jgi:hypothetical protein